MPTLNPIQYLANIIAISQCDKKLSDKATVYIAQIQKHRKFKKSELNAALKLLSTSTYQLTPTGTFVQQVQNLEDMMTIVYCDNELTEAENTLGTTQYY